MVEQSSDFAEALWSHLSGVEFDGSAKSQLTESVCVIAIEHGHSVRTLVAVGNPTSAIAMIRLQFETTVRAIWILFAADEEWASRYITPIGSGPVNEPRTPSMDEMLVAIHKNAPPAVGRMLGGLKDAGWKPMNSYVHDGIHPVIYTRQGYPPEFMVQTLRNSNGLSSMVAMVIAMMSGDPNMTRGVREIQLRHKDCLPPLTA
jgi:hypothetical protein